jgi:hypothetical protein
MLQRWLIESNAEHYVRFSDHISCRAPGQDEDLQMEVDSDGGPSSAPTIRAPTCVRSEEERWMTPHGEIVRRWNREEWCAKEDLIKEKAMIIRCQRRSINQLRRKLQEKKDSSFLEREMQGLVENVENLSLGSKQPWRLV